MSPLELLALAPLVVAIVSARRRSRARCAPRAGDDPFARTVGRAGPWRSAMTPQLVIPYGADWSAVAADVVVGAGGARRLDRRSRAAPAKRRAALALAGSLASPARRAWPLQQAGTIRSPRSAARSSTAASRSRSKRSSSVAALFSLLLAYARPRRSGGGGVALLLWSATGAMLMAGAANLLTIFLGFELLSLALYCLCGLGARGRRARIALKYLILSSTATAFMLYGMALLFGATGSVSLAALLGPECVAALFDSAAGCS
jgi:NADH:ubiquinone oxidoreductase subunit 2 (subunit N)